MEPAVRISGRDVPVLLISGLTERQARLLQDLSVRSGAALAVSISPKAGGYEAVVTSEAAGLRSIPALLASLTGEEGALSAAIQSFLDNYFRSDYKLKCKGRVIDLGSRTHVMGILNVTPDSFSDGGSHLDPSTAFRRARQMAEEGADVIDVGGESTRPGAEAVPEDEELRRIIPVIERIAAELPVLLSVDTYKSRVAERALAAGASIVNDISGLRFSPDMAAVAAAQGAAVVIMHIKGTPRDMQKDPVYGDVVAEVAGYLQEGIELAQKAGVGPDSIMVDPGIGFGKTVEHNLALLGRLDELRTLGKPILLGTSRKSFIGVVLGITDPALRLEGTAATVAAGIERGARVIRVHDVEQMSRVARMTDAIVRQANHQHV